MIRASSILTPEEIIEVVQALRAGKVLTNRLLNLCIFRLALYGLRVGEIAALEMRDIVPTGPNPEITVRKDATKGARTWGVKRVIPMNLDLEAWVDVTRWYTHRRDVDNARPTDRLIVSALRSTYGNRLNTGQIAKRWTTALRVLGPERRRQLSIHKGRHTFVSYCLRAGYDLCQTQVLAGHKSISSTNVYAHALLRISDSSLYPAPSAPVLSTWSDDPSLLQIDDESGRLLPS